MQIRTVGRTDVAASIVIDKAKASLPPPPPPPSTITLGSPIPFSLLFPPPSFSASPSLPPLSSFVRRRRGLSPLSPIPTYFSFVPNVAEKRTRGAGGPPAEKCALNLFRYPQQERQKESEKGASFSLSLSLFPSPFLSFPLPLLQL